MKTCFTCKKEKEESEFHKDKNRPGGRYPNCKECRRPESRDYVDKHRQAILEYQRQYREENYVSILLKQIKLRAERKGIPFDLKAEDLKIPSHCPVLGIPIIYKSGVKRSHNSPSVDRINNSKGYTRDNIIVVSWRANDLKADACMFELEKVIKFYKKYET